MAARPSRLHWLDWLRVLAVLGIFVYHCGLPFAGVAWLIRNPSGPFLLVAGFAGVGYLFGMPLVFFVSGAATAMSFPRESTGGYIRSRVLRLLVPMAAGIVLISPLQAYVHALAVGRTEQPLLVFGIDWLRNIQFAINPTWFGAYGYHLWFLGFLFCYAVIGLPFFDLLDTAPGRRFWDAIVRWSARPGFLLFLFVPIAAVQVVLRAKFPTYGNWADFCYWLLFYLYGYLLGGRREILANTYRHWRPHFLTVAICLALFALFGLLGEANRWLTHPAYSLGYLFFFSIWALNAWACVLLSLALAMGYLNVRNAFLDYANEGILPFYVIHHPIVVASAYLVVRTSLGVATKFFLVLTPTLLLTVLIYEFGIRRWNVMRVVFGLKPRRKGMPASRPPAAMAAATGGRGA